MYHDKKIALLPMSLEAIVRDDIKLQKLKLRTIKLANLLVIMKIG
jgi:hypothetical protein